MAEKAGFEIEVEATILWGKLSDLPAGPPYGIAADDAGTHVLVRSFHLLGGVARGLGLWDLAARRKVPGDWLGLLPDGRRGLRASGQELEVAEIATGQVLARIASSSALSVCPDAPLATTWLREDSRVDARPTALHWVFDLGTGERVHELAGGSVLEAFLPGGRLAAIDPKGGVTVWDLAAGKVAAKGSSVKKPLGVRLDRARTRMVITAADGAFVVLNTASLERLFEGKSPVMVQRDASFADGRHVVAGGALLDVETGEAKANAKAWLKGKRQANRDVVLPLAAWPLMAVLTQRVFLGPRVVEVWDADAEVQLGSVEVPAAPAAMVVLPGDRLVIAHEPVTPEEDDDPGDSPALTLLAVHGRAGGVPAVRQSAAGASGGEVAAVTKAPEVAATKVVKAAATKATTKATTAAATKATTAAAKKGGAKVTEKKVTEKKVAAKKVTAKKKAR